MKKRYVIAFILILTLTVALMTACGGGGGAGARNDGGGAGGASLAITDEDPCPCCPDCVQKECECAECGDSDDCKCSLPGGGDNDSAITFKVEHKTHYHGEVEPVLNDVQLSGAAIVKLDQFDEETGSWSGTAEGVGQYDNWEFTWDSGDELILASTGFDYNVQLSWYDPLSEKGVIVAFDRFESDTVEQIAPNAPELSGPIPSHTNMLFKILASEFRDEENGLFYFEIPLENGVGQKTYKWQGDGVNAHSSATLELTITVTRIK